MPDNDDPFIIGPGKKTKAATNNQTAISTVDNGDPFIMSGTGKKKENQQVPQNTKPSLQDIGKALNSGTEVGSSAGLSENDNTKPATQAPLKLSDLENQAVEQTPEQKAQKDKFDNVMQVNPVDKIKILNKPLSDNTNQSPVSEGQKVKVQQKVADEIFPTGLDAKNFLDAKGNLSDLTGDDKYLAEVAAPKAYDYNQVANNLDVSASIEEAAMKQAAAGNSSFASQLQTIQDQNPDIIDYKQLLGSAATGALVNKFLQNPNVVAYLAQGAQQEGKSPEEIQQLQKDYEDTKNNLLTKYPDYGTNVVANEVSRAVEKSGYNSPIANFGTDKRHEITDQIANELFKDDPQKLAIWKSKPQSEWDKILDVGGFFNAFAERGEKTFGGIKNTLSLPFTSTSEDLQKQLNDEATRVYGDRQGVNKIATDMGDATGFVASLAATGNVLGGSSLANQVALGTTVFGDTYKEKLAQFDGNPVKALASATTNTVAFMSLSDIFPATKVGDAMSKITPELDNITNQLADGAITREAARDMANTAFKNVVDWGKSSFKQNIKASAEMTALTAFQQQFDRGLGISKPDDQNLGDVFKSMFLSNLLVAGAVGYGDVKRNNDLAKESLYDAASNPKRFERIIQEDAIVNPESKKDAQEKLQNLQVLSTVKQRLDDNKIPVNKQKSYLLHTANEEILKKQIEDIKPTGDAVLDEKQKEKVQGLLNTIEKSREVRRSILDDKNVDDALPQQEDIIAQASPEQAAIKEALKSQVLFGQNKVMAELSIDTPEKSDEFLKVVADQALNKQGYGTSDEANMDNARHDFGDKLVDMAIEKYPKEEPQPENVKKQTSIPDNENLSPENKSEVSIPDISVGEMIDKTGTYKGERGNFYEDGKTVVFKVEGKNKEYELGNIDEIKDKPISDFGITHEKSVVNVNNDGTLNVRGNDYINNYSDPLQAINRDKEGNVISVNLETADGKKRTFRGNIAEDIAYQIHLKEINKNNETRSEFEQHLNEDAEASKQLDDARLFEAAKTETVADNEPVSREKISPIVKENNEEQLTPVQEQTKSAKLSYDDFRKRMIDEIPIVKDSSLDFRITFPYMAWSQVEGALSDIEKGKMTQRSEKLEANLKSMYEKGIVSVNRGRGNHVEAYDIPIEDWFGLNKEEQKAAETLPDDIVQIINENDITPENIDNLKHLFNGFPYTKEDFDQVKDYLSGKGKSDEQNQPVSENGETEQTNIENIKTKGGQNASSIESTTEMGEQPSGTSSTGGQSSEGVGSSQQGAETTGTQTEGIGGGEPPVEEQEKVVEGEDPEMTKVANAINDARIENKYGVEALDKIIGQLQDTDVKSIYEDVKDRASKDNSYIKRVRERVLTTRSGSEKDQAALLYDLAQLKGTEKELQKEILRSDDPKEQKELQKRLMDVQNEMQDNALANRFLGRAASTIFRVRQLWVNKEYDLASMQDEYKVAKGVKELTPEQERIVKGLYDSMRESRLKMEGAKMELEKAREENAKLQEENKRLQELKEKVVTQKKADRKLKSDDAIAKSNERINKAKDDLRKLGGNLNAGFDPKIAIAIGKIAAEKVYQGVVKFDELVQNVLDDVKDIFPSWTEKDVINHLLTTQDKNGKIVPSLTSERYIKSKSLIDRSDKNLREKEEAYMAAQKEVALKQFEWQRDRRADTMRDQPLRNRIIDFMLRWQRFAVLSYPSTVAKLLAVVGHQLFLKPFKFALQKLQATLLPKSITSKQSVWGNPEWSSLAKYYSSFIRNFSLTNLKEQFSGIDTKELLYGNRMMYDEWAASKGILEMPGRAHGYIKSFIKNPEFQFAHEQQIVNSISKMSEIENKLKDDKLTDDQRDELNKEYERYDITNEDVMERINKLALEHSKWAILMNDNKFVEKFQKFARDNGALGALIKSELPIVKIPINYVSRAFATKYGLIKAITGSKWYGGDVPSAMSMIFKGTENLTEKQADLLGKTLSIGSMGAAFFLLGYFNRKNTKLNDDGSIELFGQKLSKNIIHSPEFESYFSGAETGNKFDKEKKKNGFEWAVDFAQSDWDIAKKNPFANLLTYGFLPNVATTLLSKQNEDAKQTRISNLVANKIVNMAIPGFVKQGAQWADTKEPGIHPMGDVTKRKPQGDNLEQFWQTFELAIPGLRENVPKSHR